MPSALAGVNGSAARIARDKQQNSVSPKLGDAAERAGGRLIARLLAVLVQRSLHSHNGGCGRLLWLDSSVGVTDGLNSCAEVRRCWRLSSPGCPRQAAPPRRHPQRQPGFLTGLFNHVNIDASYLALWCVTFNHEMHKVGAQQKPR